MWMGLQTLFSLERCPQLGVPFIERFHCNIKVKVRSGAQDHHLLVNLLHLKLVLVVLLLVLGKVCHEQFILHRDIFLSISIFKVLLQVGYAKVTLKGGRLWEG